MTAKTAKTSKTKSSKTSTAQQQGHSVFVTLLFAMVGVSLLAIFADLNEGIGKVAVALMAGWLLIFLMTNAVFLQDIEEKL